MRDSHHDDQFDQRDAAGGEGRGRGRDLQHDRTGADRDGERGRADRDATRPAAPPSPDTAERNAPGRGGQESAATVYYGVDIDGPEPTEALARAVYRLGRRVATFDQRLKDARAELRQAGQALEEDKMRRANARRVEVAAALEDAGLPLDLLKEIAAAKAAGDTERLMRLLGAQS